MRTITRRPKQLAGAMLAVIIVAAWFAAGGFHTLLDHQVASRQDAIRASANMQTPLMPSNIGLPGREGTSSSAQPARQSDMSQDRGRSEGHGPETGETVTVSADSTYTEPPQQTDGVACEGLASQQPDCYFIVTGYTDYEGHIQGRETYSLEVRPDGSPGAAPGDFSYEGISIFTNTTIVGCGTGGFALYNDNGHWHPSQGAIDGGYIIPGENDWHLVPGSGSGGLVGLVSGQGHITFKDGSLTPAGLQGDPAASPGIQTGIFTCTLNPSHLTSRVLTESAQ